MTFSELLDSIKGVRVTVLGDLMLDEYVFGKATRISPEAPVMVVRQTGAKAVPGGAANVAKNVVALGGEVEVLGVAGADEAGDRLETALKGLPGSTTHLVREGGRVTTRKTRVVADHAHQVLRIDHEDQSPLREETENQLLNALRGSLKRCQVVVLSDYLKGVLTRRLAKQVVALAKEAGVPVVVNPKPTSVPLYAGATLISLNRPEIAGFLGEPAPETREQAVGMARRARALMQSEVALVTLGEDGMVADWTGGGACVPAPKVEVYDTAGAGDTVVATVALGLAAAGVRREIFELASQASARVVQHVGVAVPDSADLAAIRSLS